jgi:hypothetical protein
MGDCATQHARSMPQRRHSNGAGPDLALLNECWIGV